MCMVILVHIHRNKKNYDVEKFNVLNDLNLIWGYCIRTAYT